MLLQEEWVDYCSLFHPSRQVVDKRLFHGRRESPGVYLVFRKPPGDFRLHPVPGILQELTQPRLPQFSIDVTERFRPGEDFYGHLLRLEV